MSTLRDLSVKDTFEFDNKGARISIVRQYDDYHDSFNNNELLDEYEVLKINTSSLRIKSKKVGREFRIEFNQEFKSNVTILTSTKVIPTTKTIEEIKKEVYTKIIKASSKTESSKSKRCLMLTELIYPSNGKQGKFGCNTDAVAELVSILIDEKISKKDTLTSNLFAFSLGEKGFGGSIPNTIGININASLFFFSEDSYGNRIFKSTSGLSYSNLKEASEEKIAEFVDLLNEKQLAILNRYTVQ